MGEQCSPWPHPSQHLVGKLLSHSRLLQTDCRTYRLHARLWQWTWVFGRLIRLKEVKRHLGEYIPSACCLLLCVRTRQGGSRMALRTGPCTSSLYHSDRRLLLRLLPVFYNSSLKGEGSMVFLLKGLLVSYTQGAKLSEFCLATQNHTKWLPPNTRPDSNCPESVTGRLSGTDSGRDSRR